MKCFCAVSHRVAGQPRHLSQEVSHQAGGAQDYWMLAWAEIDSVRIPTFSTRLRYGLANVCLPEARMAALGVECGSRPFPAVYISLPFADALAAGVPRGEVQSGNSRLAILQPGPWRQTHRLHEGP